MIFNQINMFFLKTTITVCLTTLNTKIFLIMSIITILNILFFRNRILQLLFYLLLQTYSFLI